MKIYLAGPLFSEAERDWMKKLKGQIESLAAESGRSVQVVWPSGVQKFKTTIIESGFLLDKDGAQRRALP